MNKKCFKMMLILLVAFFLTGCVKYDVTMEVGKDKSMNLVIIEAFDQSMINSLNSNDTYGEYDDSDDWLYDDSDDSSSMIDTGYSLLPDEEELKKKFENNGYYVQKYEEEGKTGFKATKQIKNIDDFSTEAKLTKEEMTEALSGDKQYMFTVKKSFFKNTYSATYSFNTSSMNDSSIIDRDYDETCAYTTTGATCTSVPVEDQEANRKAFDAYVAAQEQQMQQLTDGLDMKFNLKVPYAVKVSNATSVTNGGKTLLWDLSKVSDVEFQFEIYNMTNVYIVGGIFLFIILAILISIINSFSKNKAEKNNKGGKIYQQPSFLTREEDGYSSNYNSFDNSNDFSSPYSNTTPGYTDNSYNNSNFVDNSQPYNAPQPFINNNQDSGQFLNPGVTYTNNGDNSASANISIPPMNSSNNNQNNQY